MTSGTLHSMPSAPTNRRERDMDHLTAISSLIPPPYERDLFRVAALRRCPAVTAKVGFGTFSNGLLSVLIL